MNQGQLKHSMQLQKSDKKTKGNSPADLRNANAPYISHPKRSIF